MQAWSLCTRSSSWLPCRVVSDLADYDGARLTGPGDAGLIVPFLTEIGKERGEDGIDTAAAALHLAVRCAPCQSSSPCTLVLLTLSLTVSTIHLLLSHRAISPNAVHSDATPLHLAASLGRADVVSLLLDQDAIDDTIRDAQGRTCRDLARSQHVARLIDGQHLLLLVVPATYPSPLSDSRSFLTASYRSLLRSYILSPPSDPPPPALLALLSSPRASLLDLSYLDDASGSAILHEAARRKDLRLIELAIRAGADVFVRNRRGKMPLDSAGKDDKVRVFLRQCEWPLISFTFIHAQLVANHDRSLSQTPVLTNEPPTLKGYLNKYTNVARGYNTRWFVLTNGVLSCLSFFFLASICF